MRILNATPLKLGCFAYRRDPGAHRLAVLVKATCAIEHGARARLLPADEQPMLRGDEPFDDDRDASSRYSSDFAPHKPRADVMLIGTFHHPDGATRGVGRASLRVGRMHKAVAVLGERQWIAELGGYKQSEAKPFRSMPLRYERAFGGAGYAANPVGMGFIPEGADPQAKPLPRIELADRVMKSPLDRLPPAGLGPVDRRWTERTHKLGTYDDKWLAERWPCFPLDFDWSYFNAAPGDQQVQGYLRGDEEIACEGLHPRHARFETRLPGLRPRAFLRRSALPDEEVALSLDTLWIDMDTAVLTLVWRGSATVMSKRFEEVDAALCVVEQLGDAPMPGALYAAPSYWEPPPPRADELTSDELREVKRQTVTEAPPEVEVARGDAEVIAEVRQFLVDAGASNETIAKVDGVESMEELLALVEKEATAPDDLDEVIAKATAQGIADAQRLLREQGVDPTAFAGQPEPPAPPPDLRLTREELAQRHAAGQSLEGVNASGLNLSRLDLRNANLSGANLVKTRLAGTMLAGAILRGADLSEASSVSATPWATGQLEPVDLSDAHLADAKLEGADLPGARLSRADLTNAKLKGAKLAGALIDGAVLENADLSAADLSGVDASEASFGGAILASANLGGALLVRADLTKANLQGAVMDRAVLRESDIGEATLRHATLKKANATGASFRAADLSDADLSEAIFEDAQLTGCVLDRVRFDRVNLRGASLENARGEEVSMSSIDLTGARAGGASFPRGLFDGVKADDSVWMGAKLGRARFAEASLLRANFAGADLADAIFHRAVLKSARLDGANLQRAMLTKVNLFRGSLDSADLTGADCRGSNFFECELLDAVLDKARFERSNLRRTVLDRPGAGPPSSRGGLPPSSRAGVPPSSRGGA